MGKSYLKIDIQESAGDEFKVIVDYNGSRRILSDYLVTLFLEKKELFGLFAVAVSRTLDFQQCEQCPRKNECKEVNQKCTDTGAAMKQIIENPPGF